MQPKRAANGRPSGLSLLEMMVATTIMATLMTSVVVVVRSGYGIWNAQEADIDVLENGYGALRHFAQQLRQATTVTAISNSGDPAGTLSFTTASGATRTWTRSAAQSEVYFNNGVSNQLLARGITSLSFTGYEADGVTATTVVPDIQMVQCNVQVTLPRGAGVTRTLSSKAWIRTW